MLWSGKHTGADFGKKKRGPEDQWDGPGEKRNLWVNTLRRGHGGVGGNSGCAAV